MFSTNVDVMYSTILRHVKVSPVNSSASTLRLIATNISKFNRMNHAMHNGIWDGAPSHCYHDTLKLTHSAVPMCTHLSAFWTTFLLNQHHRASTRFYQDRSMLVDAWPWDSYGTFLQYHVRCRRTAYIPSYQYHKFPTFQNKEIPTKNCFAYILFCHELPIIS